MSSSAANIKPRRRKPAYRKFHDGMTDDQFKRLFNQRHREFFEKRGIDPTTLRTGGFDAGFSKRKNA
jgi:hypothetical protein